MRESILIYGGGGHAKAIIDLIRKLNTWQIAGIVDDQIAAGTLVSGIPVLGTGSILPQLKCNGVHSAVNTVGGIGDYTIRWKIFESLVQNGYDFPVLVHPSAFVEATAALEPGVQVLPMSYISSDAQIGFGTLINAGVVISHDCCIGRCVNLSPGAKLAGYVQIGDFAQIGMNASVNLNLKIGKEARIGNGAVIKADVPDKGRVYAGQVWPYRRMLPDSESGNIRKIA